jgi:acetyltransferase-like isoleucine patch superfamily enzyme
MFNRLWNRKFTGLPALVAYLILLFWRKLFGYCYNLIMLANIGISGRGCKLLYPVTWRYPGNIIFGDSVTIAQHTRIESEFADSTCFIGQQSQLSRGVRLDFTGNLTIGSNVLISEYASVYTHDHGRDPRSKPVKTPLVIGDGAWIGAHSIILEGVERIGRNAIVAAGAVVTRCVPDNMIVAGIPAKVIGERKLDNEGTSL